MPTVVSMLDAIHLASTLHCAEYRETGLLFGTHDRSQAAAARALVFEVVGVSRKCS